MEVDQFFNFIDNEALVKQCLRGKTFNTRRIFKLNDIVGELAFDIKHISSTQNVLADYISWATYKNKSAVKTA